MLTYKHINKKTLTTTPTQIQEAPKRIGILIQNLSANTIYVNEYGKLDQNAALEVPAGFEYEDEVGASSKLSISASAADTDCRIEEIFQV